MQQIAAGVGSASVTSVYFTQLPAGQAHAVTVSLLAVDAIMALCLTLFRLLPRKAAVSGH